MPRAISQKNRILIAFACIYLCWGATYGAIHIAGLYLAPPLVGAIRSLFSTAIIAGICMARGTSLRVSARAAWRLALVGILLMTVNNVLLVWGETMIATGLSSLIIAMVPIFVAVIETALPGGETLNLRGWAGTLLGVLGMAVLLSPTLRSAAAGSSAATDRSLAGFAILIVAALAFASGSVLSRRFHLHVDAFVATAGGNFHTAHWTRSSILAILFLSIIGSVVGLTAYTYLLQHVPVTKVSTYAFVNPVVAVLIGAAMFHERFARIELAGMALILCAVATVVLSRTRPSAPPTDPMLELPIEE